MIMKMTFTAKTIQLGFMQMSWEKGTPTEKDASSTLKERILDIK